MKCSLYILILLLALCMVIDAKPKKTSSKFEGDFEFVDEVRAFLLIRKILELELIYPFKYFYLNIAPQFLRQ